MPRRATVVVMPVHSRIAGHQLFHMLVNEQRIDVEIAQPIQTRAAEKAVVERALEQIGVAGVAGDQQHAPVPENGGDRGAALAVTGIGGQLIGIADGFTVVA